MAADAFCRVDHRFAVIERQGGHGALPNAIAAPDAPGVDNGGFAQCFLTSGQGCHGAYAGNGQKEATAAHKRKVIFFPFSA